MRFIGERTQPDLKRFQSGPVGPGLDVMVLQFAPPLGKIRGFSTRFHLYAVESSTEAVEPDDVRFTVFRGADGCVFIGGPDGASAIGRVNAAYAGHGYTNVPIIFGAPEASPADALARGRALGFPDADAVAIDAQTGAGVFEAFKGIAKKLLSSLGGRPTVSRATPAPGTRPLVIP